MCSKIQRSENEHDKFAREAFVENKYFIKAVTEFADAREVVASEDIYSKNGIKLVRNGTRLSGGFYDRLVAHKLLKPIEHSLSVTDPIDSAKLINLAYAAARRVPSLVPRLAQADLLERLQRYFGDLEIPAPLALKLSVMQADRPKLFEHSIIVAMLSAVLGIRGNLPIQELRALTLAGIFHDIGELCIAPEIIAPNHRMDNDERRHLYAHPITGFLMLRGFRELPKGTAMAVLQHHERLDGKGYPYGLLEKQTGTVSRFLAVAEFAASLLEKNGADNRINMKLRLNLDKFDALAIGILSRLFADSKGGGDQLPDEVSLMVSLAQAGSLFENWIELLKQFSTDDMAKLSFLVERVDDLRMMVLEPGYDHCNLEELLALTEDKGSEIYLELTVMIDELIWQFTALSREVEQKLADPSIRLGTAPKNALENWLSDVRLFVSR